ncbi:non-ribosomal peptide synthetase [Paenibacillus sp. 37]|nr:non-ribosomal peptide synthetase [Paenibacillus sp. 37]
MKIKKIYPLTPMQEGMLFHSIMEKKDDAYHEQASFTIKGTLNIPYFQRSLDELVQRHDILRTSFVHTDLQKPRQIVREQREIQISFHDLSNMNTEDQEEEIRSYKAEDRCAPFDMAKDPLIRLKLFQTEPESFNLVWTFHHILLDGWCISLFFGEWFEIYEATLKGQKPKLDPVVPYHVYIQWLEKQDKERARKYWRELIAGYEDKAELPLRKSNVTGELYDHQCFNFSFNENLTGRLQELARINGATMNTLLQVLWGVLLQRYNGTDDVVFGAVVSGRPSNLEGVERMMGLFINTVPVRVQSSEGDTAIHLLKRLQHAVLESETYSYYPLYEIQAESALKQELFDHIMVFENYPIDEKMKQDETRTAVITGAEVMERTSYGFDLTVLPGKSLGFKFNFNAKMYDSMMIQRIAQHFTQLAEQIVDQPDELLYKFELLPEKEKIVLNNWGKGNVTPLDSMKSIPEWFEEQVVKSPEHTAILFEDKVITYKQLNDAANRIANYLRSVKVGPETLVGLLLERSELMIAGILGIWKAGGAYVPIDPDYPQDRIRYMIKDSGVKVVLTQARLIQEGLFEDETNLIALDQLETETEPSEEEPENSLPTILPESLAYVIYTSGSTGLPKGVMVEHRSLSHYINTFSEYFDVSARDCMLQQASYAFDTSLEEIFPVLVNGGTLFISDKDTVLESRKLVELMVLNRVTMVSCSPHLLNELNRSLENVHHQIRAFVSGGDVLKAHHFGTLMDKSMVVNSYGPTEATVCALYYECTSVQNDAISIGKPIANTEIFIMNRWGQQQPIGVAGELCITGAGLARGYLHRADLTAEKFVQHPYKPAERMYKTGDLARWLPNGNVEYMGRVDHQVKIRGYRIETGEIESNLQHLPGVQDAFVAVQSDKEGQPYLAAYVVMNSETISLNLSILRSGLQETLPDYMIPERFVAIEQLPLTPNGKVDRKALPEPLDVMASGKAYAAPRDEWETKMVQVWQDVLERGRISIYDHFFELGGHSLKAMALVSALQKQLQIEMPLRQIFNTPILHDLAQYAARAAQSRFEPIQPLAPKTAYPVSSAQRRLLILNQIGEKQTSYNMPMAVRLQGDLDVEKLETALQRMVERHEALRTSFTWVDGEPLQIIHENVPYRLERLGQLEASEKLGSSLRQKLSELIQPFDLQQAPLMRTWLAEQGQSDYVLVMDMHHIISDGVSTAIFWDELSRMYRGETLEPLELSYKDYASWEQAQMDSESMKDQESYWLDQLSGELPILELPLDRPRPLVQSFEGDRITFELEKETTDRLQELAAESGSTLYMLLMAAFQVWLTRYSGQEDIVVGTPIAGRRHADTEQMLGMFVNTLALRGAPTREKTFTAFLSEVKTTLLQAYENQEYAFDRLVEKLEVRRDASRNPLFDALFAMQDNTTSGGWNLVEEEVTPLEIEFPVAKFDLSIEAVVNKVGIVFSLEYASQLFDRTTAQRMGDHWLKLLREIAFGMELTIGAIEMISEPEREELHRFNRTEVPLDIEKTAADWFEEQVAERPEATALIFNETCWTYDELNRLANRVAWHLQATGIGAGRLVGIMADRSVELIAGILGVWKAGGAYVPLDPDYPEERIAYMLMDSGVDVVLTQSHLEERVTQHGVSSVCMEALAEEAEEVVNPMRTNAAGDIAYVIYTSGSTGKPKGVMVEHRGVANLRQMFCNRMNITSSDHILQFASISFDASVWEITQSVLLGAVLCMPDRETVRDAWELTQWMAEKEVTIATLPPGFALYVDVQLLPKLRMLITAGSAATESLLEHTKGITYINAYGPTESTVCATMWQRPAGQTQGSVPIGGPIDNTEIYIMDEAGRMQPIGVAGELCIAGMGLARGYLNRAELTAEKFVAHPDRPGERMYKTGDLARWLPDGTLEYLGRKDEQLKIRGYRIEIGEIEAALDQMDGVREAVVVPRKDQDEQVYLCAYCVPVEEKTTGSQLRSGLLRILPEYMVPSQIIIMSQLPLTPNGKVDKKALPEPEEAKAARTSYVAPRTQMEEDMVEIWQEVLGVSQVSIDDHFFELGGHSLKAMNLIQLVRAKLKVELTLQVIFKNPVLETLADIASHSIEVAYEPISRSEHKEVYPVSSTQKRMLVLNKMEGKQTTYNMPVAVRLYGELKPDQLEHAILRVIERHEILRTSFEWLDDQPVQRIHEKVPFYLEKRDLRFQGDNQTLEKQIYESMFGFIHPFELNEAPLIRARLLQCKEAEFVLLIDMHHIISDGTSMQIFWKDLSRYYEGSTLETLEIGYKDYAVWEQKQLSAKRIQHQETFWLDTFSGELPVLSFPTDYPRTAKQSFEGDSLLFHLNQELSDGLNKLATETGSTLYMVLLAAFQVLLGKYSGQDDIIVGTPIAGRNHADVHDMFGVFINTLALRGRPNKEKSFLDFLSEVKSDTIKAFEHQDYPFERLVEQLDLKRDLSRNPLFDVLFSMQNLEVSTNLIGNLEYEMLPLPESVAKLDLSMQVTEIKDGIEVGVEYASRLFERATMERFAEHWRLLLIQIASNPSIKLADVDLVSSNERRQLLETFNNTEVYFEKDETILVQFEKYVELTPDKTAIICGKTSWTYREVNRHANRIARLLLEQGLEKQSLVGLVSKRSIELLSGMLGILKAGAAYVPIDPEHPEDRIQYMLEDCNARFIVTDGSLSGYISESIHQIEIAVHYDEDLREDNIELSNYPEAGDLAYVIYTSGSTGRPKGVMLEHRGLKNFCEGMRDRLPISSESTVLSLTTVSFDIFVLESLLPLMLGATVVLATEDEIQSPKVLSELVSSQYADIIQLTPSRLRLLLDAGVGHCFSNLSAILLGGEALPPTLLNRLSQVTSARIYNMYGPTETTVWSTVQELTDGSHISIGKPIINSQIYILNEEERLQPIGIVGELCIAGAGLARGYWNREDLTAKAFVQNPFNPGARMYKTGDLARWLPDGNLDYIGRADNQVKIRGYRIELSEIEAVLLRHESVINTAVIVNTDPSGEGMEMLVAYLVIKQDISAKVIQKYLQNILPTYMIPAQYVVVEAMPLNANGKIDRRKLKEVPIEVQLHPDQESSEPLGKLETLVYDIWTEVLGKSDFGVEDDFFEIGGNSINAIHVEIKLEQQNITIEDSMVFKYPSVRKIAENVSLKTLEKL